MPKPPDSRRLNSLAWAVLCAGVVLAWQSVTVHCNFGGNWSALFYTGGLRPVPGELARAENIYRFPGSTGWDGQLYHYVAHDPFLQTGLQRYIDAPRLRYRRILIPALAYAFAGGRSEHIDIAYRCVILLFFVLGAYWLSRLAIRYGRSPAWGLTFLLIPGAIVSADRLAVDVGMAAFTVGFVLLTESGDTRPWALFLFLAVAGLARDTGTLLTAAYCLWLLVDRRLLRAAVFAAAAIPTLAWYFFVSRHTTPYVFDGTLAIPFTGAIHRILHPMPYPSLPPAVVLAGRTLDILAVCGVLFAFVLAIRLFCQGRLRPSGWAIVLFTLLALFVWRPGDWQDAIDYGRILSPLLVLLALRVLESPGRWIYIAPLAAVLPRLGLGMGSQIRGILAALLR